MKKLLMVICLGISGLGMSQNVVQTESYTGHPATHWTAVGSNVEVDHGILEWDNCADSSPRRVYTGIASTPTRWMVQFEFEYTDWGSWGPGHLLTSLTADSIDPISNSSGTSYPATNNSTVTAMFGSPGSPNQSDDSDDFRLQGGSKLDNGGWQFSDGIHLAPNTLYTVVLERMSGDQGQISTYTGTVLIPANLVGRECFSIPSAMESLNFLQHGNASWGSGSRSLTATLDNTTIWHYCTSSFAKSGANGSLLSGPETKNNVTITNSTKSQVSTDESYIQINNLDLNSSIEVYNLSGQKIYGKKSSDSKLRINMSNYSKGIYMVKVTNKKGATSQKVMLD